MENANQVRNEELRITEIVVQNLFGVYNHTVKLNERERVTIIHGPNGVGKTALLKLTKSLLSGRYDELVKTPFSHFYVTFNDGSKAGVEKSTANDPSSPMSLYHESNKKNGRQQIQIERQDSNRLADLIEKNSPFLIRAHADLWVDRRTEELLSASEVVARFSDQLPEKMQNKLFKDVPELKSIPKKTKAHLIEAQRLIKFVARDRNWRSAIADRSMVDTVDEYSQDLKRRIADTLAAYGKESQRLDQSFPQRLINLPANTKSIEELKDDFHQIEEQRKNLKKIGLIDDNEDLNHPFNTSSLESLDKAQQSVMTLYIEDSQKKLDTLKDLAQRVEILLDNMNRKFIFTRKSLSIRREEGLIANDPNGNLLSLSSLSSGEQHEIVLLYDLLFKVEKNALVLIDEPELSLHVSWQKDFLEDLTTIIEIAQFDVLLATHSPYIVGDRSDLMVELAAEPAQAPE